jgi:hypothetical protein
VLESVLKESGAQAITLYGSVNPRRRERWIEDHGYADALITNPRLVQTGLDLVSFQTVVFYEPEYSLYTLWQALRRVWRLGQTQPVKAVFAVYRGTMEAQALADGVLVGVSPMAREAGFRFPTAIAADLHARLTPNEREKALGQGYDGRLWDVLFLAVLSGRKVGYSDRASFEVSLFKANDSPPHRTHRRTLSLWVVVGLGDDGEPVITIGFPEDF